MRPVRFQTLSDDSSTIFINPAEVSSLSETEKASNRSSSGWLRGTRIIMRNKTEFKVQGSVEEVARFLGNMSQ